MEEIKIVINRCFGGFGISDVAIKFLRDKYNLNVDKYPMWLRDDPRLVDAVETLGKAANGKYASLKVVSIPANVNWEISEYDGMETIEEVHRTWC